PECFRGWQHRLLATASPSGGGQVCVPIAGDRAAMKICDLTQFYSPRSGGVKRYLHEKIAYIEKYATGNEHVLIVPGPKHTVTAHARSRIYSIRSPLVSRTS